jgi:hypothetical protein
VRVLANINVQRGVGKLRARAPQEKIIARRAFPARIVARELEGVEAAAKRLGAGRVLRQVGDRGLQIVL